MGPGVTVKNWKILKFAHLLRFLEQPDKEQTIISVSRKPQIFQDGTIVFKENMGIDGEFNCFLFMRNRESKFKIKQKNIIST